MNRAAPYRHWLLAFSALAFPFAVCASRPTLAQTPTSAAQARAAQEQVRAAEEARQDEAAQKAAEADDNRFQQMRRQNAAKIRETEQRVDQWMKENPPPKGTAAHLRASYDSDTALLEDAQVYWVGAHNLVTHTIDFGADGRPLGPMTQTQEGKVADRLRGEVPEGGTVGFEYAHDADGNEIVTEATVADARGRKIGEFHFNHDGIVWKADTWNADTGQRTGSFLKEDLKDPPDTMGAPLEVPAVYRLLTQPCEPCRAKADRYNELASAYNTRVAELRSLSDEHQHAYRAARKPIRMRYDHVMGELAAMKGAIDAARTAALACPCPDIQDRDLAIRQSPAAANFQGAPQLSPSQSSLLDIHNAERTALGLTPLRWNPVLAQHATAYAQQLARTGQMVHAPREGRGTERENLERASLGFPTEHMMDQWIAEKANFVPGIFPMVSRTGEWSAVAHYTQIIWPTTTDVGCGDATGSGSIWLVCRYLPGGNKDGQPVGIPPAQAAIGNDTAIEQPKLPPSEVFAGGPATTEKPSKPATPCKPEVWIDTKTGQRVASGPVFTMTTGFLKASLETHGVRPEAGDPNRAYDPETGRNFFRDPVTCVWKDSKTGQRVASGPVFTMTTGLLKASLETHGVRPDAGDPNRAFDPDTGRNFVRQH